MTPGTECWIFGDDSSGVTTYERAAEEKRKGAESAKMILPTGLTVLVVGAVAATFSYRYARSETGTGVGPQPAEQPQDHRPSFAEAHATSALGQGDVDGARAIKTDQPAAPETSRPANTTSADDMKVLLAMVMGNHSAAGRLIDFEQRKDPGADRAVSIRRAIQRLREDRQRQG
ncbi:hypothetical protein [Nocardia sp. GTS18]|uniref:hypothetical protein n=1 Tax=Nocardia sp. GTS18 TaxID=1778064 RepID=UPI0015EE822D|nr:hypothetical protein [Nocardia sp. GTS18]